MAKTPFSVSCYDIEHVLNTGGYELASLSEEQMKEILHFVGMDSRGISMDEVLHRPMYSPNNAPWYGKRYVGFERQDREWMRGSRCSLENVITSQEDSEHKKDLMVMSLQMTNTQDACSHLANNSPSEPEIKN
mgnify:CR=1 FL=1